MLTFLHEGERLAQPGKCNASDLEEQNAPWLLTLRFFPLASKPCLSDPWLSNPWLLPLGFFPLAANLDL